MLTAWNAACWPHAAEFEKGFLMHLRRLLVVSIAALAALAVAAPALAADPSEIAVLAYQTAPGALSDTDIDLTVPNTAAATAKATVYVPAGYSATFAAPGTTIGTVTAVLTTGSADLKGQGNVVADDPAKYLTQGCAPGTHAAVWVLQLTVSGQALSIPVYVDPAGADVSARASYTLQACFTPPGAGGGLKLAEADVDLPKVFTNPASKGGYIWRALLTPYGTGDVPDATATVEVQSLVALPHKLTLKSRYDRKRHRVTLSGSLTAAGQARTGIHVRLLAGPKPTFTALKPYAIATTDNKGAYTLSRPLAKTTYFFAFVSFYVFSDGCEPTIGLAPCTHETIAPPESGAAFLTVRVPKR